MTEFNKLADVLANQGQCDEHGTNCIVSRQAADEAIAILRAAAAVDVAGLMELAAKAIYDQWADQLGWVEWVPGGNSLNQDEARSIARAALESALRMALAAREGFVMVPREGVEQIAGALADVLATFQHAEPEALKAAIQHSNRSAHAAYTLVYGLLAAAPKGTP